MFRCSTLDKISQVSMTFDYHLHCVLCLHTQRGCVTSKNAPQELHQVQDLIIGKEHRLHVTPEELDIL